MSRIASRASCERAFYLTPFGEVPLWCPLYMRASRLSEKYGRPFDDYVDGWMKFNFIAGKLAGHPDLVSRI